MQKNIVIAAVVAAVAIALVVFLSYGGGGYGPAYSPPAAPPASPPAGAAAKVVEITASGLSPGTLTISRGDVVAFVNADSAQHWPASAMHPSHMEYPEAGGCIGSTFDACRELSQGENFTFQFNYNGSWRYHDHLNPGNSAYYGTIVVQ